MECTQRGRNKYGGRVPSKKRKAKVAILKSILSLTGSHITCSLKPTGDAKAEWHRCAGFFLACEDFGRMFDHLVPTCAFVVVVKWSLARTH